MGVVQLSTSRHDSVFSILKCFILPDLDTSKKSLLLHPAGMELTRPLQTPQPQPSRMVFVLQEAPCGEVVAFRNNISYKDMSLMRALGTVGEATGAWR